jgi:hypothetical protein
VGVDEGDSDWALGLSFRVALSCPDCGAGAGDFYTTAEEARGCGIDPDANLPNTLRPATSSAQTSRDPGEPPLPQRVLLVSYVRHTTNPPVPYT